MITDIAPPHQHEAIIQANGGSAGLITAHAMELPPLPRCHEHPRREMELYCKLCATVMCSTCKETEHSRCQKKWDETMVQNSLTEDM
jgi:hypothetical protein